MTCGIINRGRNNGRKPICGVVWYVMILPKINMWCDVTHNMWLCDTYMWHIYVSHICVTYMCHIYVSHHIITYISSHICDIMFYLTKKKVKYVFLKKIFSILKSESKVVTFQLHVCQLCSKNDILYQKYNFMLSRIFSFSVK